MNKGFTLIELMVVVLIIGILSSIALPQYERSVNKARAAEAVVTAKSVVDASALYATTYRRCPSSLSDLDVKVNATTKNWTFGVANVGGVSSRNCGASVTSTKAPVFTAQRILIKNASGTGVPSGLSSGASYWSCVSGDCTEFFGNINVKQVSGQTYYQ